MFDDPEKRAIIQDVATFESMLAVTRMLVRELRVVLKAEGLYKWSKLELIDDLNVKQSDLSDWPLYVQFWHDSSALLVKYSFAAKY